MSPSRLLRLENGQCALQFQPDWPPVVTGPVPFLSRNRPRRIRKIPFGNDAGTSVNILATYNRPVQVLHRMSTIDAESKSLVKALESNWFIGGIHRPVDKCR
jgi:hypothetical protein